MWTKRDVLRATVAIITVLIVWGIVRLLFPALDYFPPERLTQNFDRSWIFIAGLRKAAGLAYLGAALVLMAVFFNAVQQRWPGRRGVKGLMFGTWIGVIWSFGFINAWAFLGTTIRAELLNSVVDLVPLAFAGWLLGLATGRDVPRSERRDPRSWPAVIFVASGFVAVYAFGAGPLSDLIGSTSGLLLVPSTPAQFALHAGLGLWVGGMYVILRERLPFKSTLAQAALFAFGVFGHSWTWFHFFFVIEFADILHELLLVGFVGALGVFAGALAYEWYARLKPASGLVNPSYPHHEST